LGCLHLNLDHRIRFGHWGRQRGRFGLNLGIESLILILNWLWHRVWLRCVLSVELTLVWSALLSVALTSTTLLTAASSGTIVIVLLIAALVVLFIILLVFRWVRATVVIVLLWIGATILRLRKVSWLTGIITIVYWWEILCDRRRILLLLLLRILRVRVTFSIEVVIGIILRLVVSRFVLEVLPKIMLKLKS